MRKLLKRAISTIFGLSVGIGLYSYWNANHVVRTDYVIETHRVDKEYKIVFVSDIHYGVAQKESVAFEMCEEISELNADMLIIGGDVLESEKQSLTDMRAIFNALGNVQTECGVFWVPGNHDIHAYVGPSRYSKQDLMEALECNGIHDITDRCMTVDGITLVGRGDRVNYGSAGRPPLSDIMCMQHDPTLFTILVDHDPNTEVLEDFDYDLKLSGHTHAGQLFPSVVWFLYKGYYRYGLYEHNGSPLIVSSGSGVGAYPLRNQNHCEYVVITIKPK